MVLKLNNKKSHNERFLERCTYSEEQKKDFIELYEKYYRYVYKYEVGHEDHYDVNNVIYQIDMDNFSQELDDAGMCIKVVEGY